MSIFVMPMSELGIADDIGWQEPIRPYSDGEDPSVVLAYALREFGLGEGRLGYEKSGYFFRGVQQESLFIAASKTTFVDCSGLVAGLRLVKSAEELACIRESARLTEAAMQAGLDAVTAGVPESDVAAAILHSLASSGSEYPSSPPIIATGWRRALARPSWQRRAIRSGELVVLELGANVNGYNTALMRSAFIGEFPAEITEAEHVLKDALQMTLEMIRPGISARDVAVRSQYLLRRYGHKARIASRAGCSVGLAFPPNRDEHEAFTIDATNSAEFQENMVLHITLCIQVPGSVSVGMSETVWLTADGCQTLMDLDRKIFRR